eukprot:m.251635 g.251635  ORF g.251635 m.251635 type:complete len:431 (+) comp40337_c1_seq5:69-1361(+)
MNGSQISIIVVIAVCSAGKGMRLEENDARQGNKDRPLCASNVISASSNMPKVTLEVLDQNRFQFVAAKGTKDDPLRLPLDDLAYASLKCWYYEDKSRPKNGTVSVVMTLDVVMLEETTTTKFASNSVQCYGSENDQFSKGKGVTRDVKLTHSFLATCTFSADGIGNAIKQIYVKIICKEKSISLYEDETFRLSFRSFFGLKNAQIFSRGSPVDSDHLQINQHKNGTGTEKYTCFAHERFWLEVESNRRKDNSTLVLFHAFQKPSHQKVNGQFFVHCPEDGKQTSRTKNTTDYMILDTNFCMRVCAKRKSYTCNAKFLEAYFGLTASIVFQPCQCHIDPTDAASTGILAPALGGTLSGAVLISVIVLIVFCCRQHASQSQPLSVESGSKSTETAVTELGKEMRSGFVELSDQMSESQIPAAPTTGSNTGVK